MFPRLYFSASYFTPFYWEPAGAIPPPTPVIRPVGFARTAGRMGSARAVNPASSADSITPKATVN